MNVNCPGIHEVEIMYGQNRNNPIFAFHVSEDQKIDAGS